MSYSPVAYWRLGEASGPTAYDLGPNSIKGDYITPIGFKTFGSTNNDPDYAVRFDEKEDTGYVRIPDNRALSLTQAWDDFNRIGSFGWGTGDGGDPWQVEVSSPAYYDTTGNVALIDPGRW